MSEELNSQILDALNQGLGPQDIIDHLAASKNPEHQAWVKNYRANAAQQESSIPAPSATMDTSLLNAAEKTAGQAAQATNDMTLGQKMALGAAAAGAAGVAGLGGYAAKQRIDTNEELRRKRLLGEEVSPAVRVQQAQLELQQKQFEASQAGGLSPLEQAKVETEKARKASLELDAEIKRQQLIDKAKAAEIATAKRAAGIPVETPKPTVQETAAKLGIVPPTAAPAAPAQLSDWASKGQSTTPPEAPNAPAEVVAPPAPVAQAPIETQPVAKTTVEQPVATETAVPPPVQELRTGTNKPAFAGQGPENPKKFKTKYDSVHDVPKGYAFVPGANTIDTARNTLGQDVYTQEFTNRNFPATNEESAKISEQINRSLGRPTNEELKAQGVKPPSGTPGVAKLIAGKRIVQVGGIVGALVAIPDIAKAATKGNYAEAGLRAADLATDYIPGVNAAKTSLSGMGLGESPEQLNEFGKRLEYIQRTGGGRGLQGSAGGGQGFRGIAPPTR